MTLQQQIPKDQVQAIVEAIISCMNLVVGAHVMNQTRGNWLLSNALTTNVNISVSMEAQVVGLGDKSEILNEFDSKLLTL